MFAKWRFVFLVLVSLITAMPARAQFTSAELADMLNSAVPREMIPPAYQNEQPPHTMSSMRLASITFRGPGPAKIQFELFHFPDFPKPATAFYRSDLQDVKASERLSTNLYIGDASYHREEKPEIFKQADVRYQHVRAYWKKLRLEVSIVNYKRLDGTQDFTHDQARHMVRKLAKACYEKIHAKPHLAEISVEQRHLTYDKAKITVKAKAVYPLIGNYDRKEITFIVRVTGPDSQTRRFDAYAPQVRQRGDDLYMEWSFETRMTGNYGTKVTLRDTRYESAASTSTMSFALEHALSTKWTVMRPVAEIMLIKRNVAVMRNEHSTVKGGAKVTSEGKYHEPKHIRLWQEICELLGEDTTDPGAFESNRVWESVESDTSHFVYNGDRVALWGERDPAFQVPEDLNDREGFLVWLRSGCSSVVLEWENGLKGEAFWNPNKINYNSPNGQYFTVGTSRGSSGKWKQTWAEWFGTNFNILAEQYVGGKVDELKQGAIDWVLKREGITLPAMPAIPLALVLFNLSAGDTLYDDLIYIQLESHVFVSAGDGELNMFTFEGSPKVLDPKGGTRVTVKPGRMVTVKDDSISQPRTFSTADLKATQKPVDSIQKKFRDPKLDRQKSGDVDIPRLNANVVKLEFFESADPPMSLHERRFTSTFDSSSARFIFWHMELDYPKRSSNTTFDLETVWYKADGSEYGRWTKKFRMEAGWSGSYYSSGWGTNESGSWKPGTYRAKVFLDGQVIAGGSFTVTGAGKTGGKTVEKKPVYDFSQWPIEHKLDVAIARLDKAIEQASNRLKQDGYSRAKQLVKQAKSAYLRYAGPDRGIFNGSTDPADCPLELMLVMRRSAEDIFQARAAWDRSPRPPSMTRAQIQSAEAAIREAEEKINAAVQEVWASRGWYPHTGREGLYLEAPPEYERFENGNWPLSLRVVDDSGRIEKLVLLTWRAKPDGMSAYDFQQQRIKDFRSSLPEFRDLVEWQTWPGVPGNWFTYKYSWEGQQVEALAYLNPFGPLPWELRILAADQPLDMAECEEIVRSLTRK